MSVEKRSLPEIPRFQKDLEVKRCNRCATVLSIPETWCIGNEKSCHYICNKCDNLKGKVNRLKRLAKTVGLRNLNAYNKIKEGYVYAISNPAWEDWVKIGMAVDAEDRCNGYQTSSPLRDYKLKHSIFVEDRRLAELEAHATIQKMGYDRRGEWFKVDIPTVKIILDKILKGD
jgi:hypothetical protein